MRNVGISINENLSSAAFHAAVMYPGLWWIDALCINQQDDDEKSQQVALMREIYSSAKQVLVNLGPIDDNTDLACNLILKLCELYQTKKLDLEGAVYQLSVPMAEKYPFGDEKLRELGLPLKDAEDWLALAKFLSRPYFERVWVLQELVVSSAPIVVFCGSLQLPWAAFKITHRCLLPLGWDIVIKDIAFAQGKEYMLQALHFVPMVEVLKHNQNNRLGLEGLLDMSRSLQATDPRDKIIALLGMAKEAEDGMAVDCIRPDYGKSVQQTYTNVTGTFIANGSLELLSSIGSAERRQIKSLPSWVPDYSSKHHNGSFAAGYEAAGGTPVSATWSPGSEELRIKGEVVDIVTSVSSYAGGSQANEFLLESFSMAANNIGSGDEYHWLSLLTRGGSEAGLGW